MMLSLTGCIIIACSSPQIPDAYIEDELTPLVYPDYCGVTIPCNIAPLCFSIEEEAKEYITSLSTPQHSWITSGRNVCPPISQWRKITESAIGSDINVDVYIRKTDKWTKQHFTIKVVAEEIDSYISYRIISPSYVAYEDLTIRERNLTNFEEREIYNNMLISTEKDGQCINCHSYQNYSTDNMQFHARQAHGGTLLVSDGKLQKINLKTDSTISAGVYPAWHPTHKLIAYSVNTTGQSFHTKHKNKVEVQDTYSDLILYDIENNYVSKIEADPNELEIYPWWSPDGKMLYYASAHFELNDSMEVEPQLVKNYKDIHYNLYRKSFDPATKKFGPKQLILEASQTKQSATLPRISPDGRHLLFAMAEYGCFHIWHENSDLYLMDLQHDSLPIRKLENINSPEAESYHSWSSNGKWIVFSSRRKDGNHTLPYIAYFDKQGKAHKPFVLPQANPEHYKEFSKSYNIPEFMKEAVKITPHRFARELKKEAKQAIYKEIK